MSTWQEKSARYIADAAARFSDPDSTQGMKRAVVQGLVEHLVKHTPDSTEGAEDAAALVKAMLPALLDSYKSGEQPSIMADLLPRLVRRKQAAAVGEAFIDAAAANLLTDQFENCVNFISLLIEYDQAQLVVDRTFDKIVELWREGTSYGYDVAVRLLDQLSKKGQAEFIKSRMLAPALELSKSDDKDKIKRGDAMVSAAGFEAVAALWQGTDAKSALVATRIFDKWLEGQRYDRSGLDSIAGRLLGMAFKASKSDVEETSARGKALLDSLEAYGFKVIGNEGGSLLIQRPTRWGGVDLFAYGVKGKQEFKQVSALFKAWKDAAEVTGRFWKTYTPDQDTKNVLRMVRAAVADLKAKKEKNTPLRGALDQAVKDAKPFAKAVP